MAHEVCVVTSISKSCEHVVVLPVVGQDRIPVSSLTTYVIDGSVPVVVRVGLDKKYG
jgi:hypothetical protein